MVTVAPHDCGGDGYGGVSDGYCGGDGGYKRVGSGYEWKRML